MINVGVVGYGTIGKRVADAVMLQDDMKLAGIVAHSYNFKIMAASLKGIRIFSLGNRELLEKNGIKVEGDFDSLLDSADIIVDATPGGLGKENKEKYYIKKDVKAVFQGGEKADVGESSFVAQVNYDDALNKRYVRVVSCNTTGLSRTINALDRAFGVVNVNATLIRRAADPGESRKGPINALVPTLELPSHHGPDVKTVIPGIEIFTTAIVASTTLMHIHTLSVEVRKEVEREDVLKVLRKAPRIRIVSKEERINSTAEIIEFARDLGRGRGDMPEVCIWKEGIGVNGRSIFLIQAVHQESIVVPENIDAIRAMSGVPFESSFKKTNESLRIE